MPFRHIFGKLHTPPRFEEHHSDAELSLTIISMNGDDDDDGPAL